VELSQLWEKRKERVRDEFSHHGLSCQSKKKKLFEASTLSRSYEIIRINVIAIVAVFGGSWLIVEVLDFVGVFNTSSQYDKLLIVLLILICTFLILSLTTCFKLKKNTEGLTTEISDLRRKLKEYQSQSSEIIKIGYKRERINYVEMIESATQRIDLLGLSLAPFITEPCISEMYDSICKRNLKIRILLLNPFSINCLKRDPELYKGILPLQHNIVESIIIFKNLKQRLVKEHRNNSEYLEVRLYSDIPTVSCFFIDDVLNISPYLTYRTGVKSPYLEIRQIDNVNSLYQMYLQPTFGR